MTSDSASATATEAAGAAGAGAMGNFDLYARIRCTRNLDGASHLKCARLKHVRACHTCSKRQSWNSLLVDLARNSILSQPSRHLFSIRAKVAGVLSRVHARILLQGRRSLQFFGIRTCTRLFTAGCMRILLLIAGAGSQDRTDRVSARRIGSEGRVRVQHGVWVRNGGRVCDSSSGRMHIIRQACCL